MENQDGAPQKKGTSRGVKIFAWVLGIGILLSILAASGNSGSSSNSPATAASNAPSDPITVACQASSSPQTISYKNLEKDPNSFQGQATTFTGQVLQIQESNGTGAMRLAVDKDSYGDWNVGDAVLVQYDGHTPAVQDDVVTVSGVMEGTQTYTSEANYQITVPLMYACSIKEGSAKTTAKATTVAPAPAQTSAPVQTSAPTQTTYTTPSGAVVNGQGQTVTAPPAPPASWHTIETFSGDTQKNTAPFTIQGSQFRVTWQESGQYYFGANTQSPDNSGNYCAIANLVGSGSDSTYCYGAGTYYISVNTANPWTITVEDYY